MLVYCNRGDLFLSASDRTGNRKLASLEGFMTAPQFSPDGRRIRITWQDLNAGNRSLWEISAEGKHLHRLLPSWHKATRVELGRSVF
jgi:Tol biopolymer transport system component